MSIVNINRSSSSNNNFILQTLSRLSIFVLLLHNHSIVNIHHKNILYYIIIISIVQIIYSIIICTISFFESYSVKNKELQKSHLNLLFGLLKIFGLLVLLNKIYKNNIEYISYFEIFLCLLLYFLISYLITSSKFLMFKTEFFKGINVLNVFNLYRLRASNISNINTDENKDKAVELIKENIEIEPNITNNTTNIGVHKHAENLIKQGVETVSKTIESGIAQAVPQLGLASSIGAGLSAGVKISAGQPLMTRVVTTAGARTEGLAGAGILVGATALNQALSQLPSKTIEENIDTPPSPGAGFINSSNEEILNNPVELLLYSIWVLQFVILIFLIVLLITFISKLMFSLNYEFNWLNKIFSAERSVQVRTMLLKYFNFVSKIREINIIVLIIILIIVSLFSLYFFSVFLLNLEGMCKLYLQYVK